MSDENEREIPVTNEIQSYLHCILCLNELPEGQSPGDYARIAVGYTELGIQIWCRRHDCNIMHMDFEGKSPFPANLNRRLFDPVEVAEKLMEPSDA